VLLLSNCNLVPIDQQLPSLPLSLRLSPAPGNHHSTVNFYEFNFLDFTGEWDNVVFVFVCQYYAT
jgi:hypothetical protein